MIALLPLWLSTRSLPLVEPAEAAARPYVVVPAALAESPKVAELRRAGARLVLSFGVNAFGPDVKSLPTDWFAQNQWGFEKAQRSGETVTLASDEALAYQIRRAQEFGAHAADWAGLVLTVDLRADQLSFRYAGADRLRAIAATGLDPIDFDDPMEQMLSGVRPTPMPPRLLEFLLADGRARARRVAQAIAAPFAAAKRPVMLRVDPALVGAPPARHMAAYGDWTTMLDLPGLTELWFPFSTDAEVRAGAISTLAPRVRLGVFGGAKFLPTGGRLDTMELRP